MKTKFKDFLLYTLAAVGTISIFLSAYQPQQSQPKYTMSASGGSSDSHMYILNQETGDVRYFVFNKEKPIQLRN